MKFSELYPLKRIIRMFWLKLLPVLPMRGTLRFRLMRFAGVDVTLGGGWGGGFIGHGTKLDSLYPEDIHLEKCVRINMDCVIMTHHLRPNNFCNGDKDWFRRGGVTIKHHSFIGARTIICISVTIGPNSIVGAGSVVTKDIPEGEVWGGNPCVFIRKRNLDELPKE